jgi:hypothetical protein
MSLVKISNTDIQSGYGLVLDSKLSPNIPYEVEKSVYVSSSAQITDNSAALLGGTRLYLLSNETEIPGKSKINFDGSVYGIEKEQIDNEIEPNTSSMVRGEELLELLDLIVRFCLTHVHEYPLLSPSSQTITNIKKDDVTFAMRNAYQKVLNSNIRIN